MDADRRDLSPTEAGLLASLDDGFAPEDSVGRPLAAMTDRELQAVDALLDRRLCQVVGGWSDSWWVRLTERGRRRTREPDPPDPVS
jgi:hypothetical protein